jgi:hypothetical protein
VLKVLIAEAELMTADEAEEVLNRQDHEVCGIVRTATDAVVVVVDPAVLPGFIASSCCAACESLPRLPRPARRCHQFPIDFNSRTRRFRWHESPRSSAMPDQNCMDFPIQLK